MKTEYIVVMKKNGVTGFSDGMNESEADVMIQVYEERGYEFVSKSAYNPEWKQVDIQEGRTQVRLFFLPSAKNILSLRLTMF